MSDILNASGEAADAPVEPVSVSRSRGGVSLLVLALLAAFAPAALDGLGLLGGLERAAGSLVDRHAPTPDPSGRVWIVRLDEESLLRLSVSDPVELWSAVLDRATADGVGRLVVLDPGSFADLAQALGRRPPGGPAVILPSRVRIDPAFDVRAGIDRPLPDAQERPFQEALLRLEPDPDGAWRRVPARELVQGTSVPTLAAVLAPAELAGRSEFAPAFNRPAGALPSAPIWSFVRGELGQAPWRGGTLVICRDEALAGREVWAPYGQALSEPRAVAQLAESLGTSRLYRAIPAALAAPLYFAIFLAAALASTRLAPLPGVLAAAGAGLGALAGAAALRVGALWILPLTPILPSAALGLLLGLARRHHRLERRMAQAGVSIGQSRSLHPLLRSFGVDAGVLRRAADLLELDGAAVADARTPGALLQVASRGEQEPFARRAKDEIPRLLQGGAPGRHLPVFAEDALLLPLGPDGLLLYLVPRAATPMSWWEENREVVDRLRAALAFAGEAPPAAPSDAAVPPERQLDVFRSAASRTEAERVLLLRLMGRLPGGVLVCDLLGRPLLHNQAIDRLAGALRLTPENYLLGLLRTGSGRDEPALWRALQQVVRERQPWTFFGKTEAPEPRHHLFQLALLDLGAGAAGVLPREVLVLSATDVSVLARMAAARSEAAPAAATPAMAAALNRMIDLLQSLLASGAGPTDQLRELREELDALKGGTATRKDTEAVEAVDLVAEIEKAVADARPIATEVGIELRVRGDELVPMALARPEALRRAFALLLRKGVSAWRRAPTLWFQAYSTGTEVVLRMSTEGGAEGGRGRESGTRISSDALARAVEEAGGRFGVGEEGDCRVAFPALAA